MNGYVHFDLICGTMAVGIMMWYTLARKMRGDYVCPACGSKNGEHDESCQWKRFYDE